MIRKDRTHVSYSSAQTSDRVPLPMLRFHPTYPPSPHTHTHTREDASGSLPQNLIAVFAYVEGIGGQRVEMGRKVYFFYSILFYF